MLAWGMRAFLLALTLLLVPMALAQGEVVAQVGPEAITREAFELRYGLFVRSALAQLGLPDTEEARALLAAYRPAFLGPWPGRRPSSSGPGRRGSTRTPPPLRPGSTP